MIGKYPVQAAYIAASGRVYLEQTHTDAVFEAQDAGEPEVKDFPNIDNELLVRAIELRMGFVADGSTHVMSRDECLRKYGLDCA